MIAWNQMSSACSCSCLAPSVYRHQLEIYRREVPEHLLPSWFQVKFQRLKQFDALDSGGIDTLQAANISMTALCPCSEHVVPKIVQVQHFPVVFSAFFELQAPHHVQFLERLLDICRRCVLDYP